MNPVKFLKRLNKAMNDPDSKSASQIIAEYTRFKFSKPGLAEQYFNKYLYRKSAGNPDDYIITHKLLSDIWYFNDMTYFTIMAHKLMTEAFFRRHNIPVVRNIAYNVNSLFFQGEELFQVHNKNDFAEFLKSLREKGLWKQKHLIIKLKQDSWGGKGIMKLAYDDVLENGETLKSIFKNAIQSGYIFQDWIIQHPDLERINPNSVNTIRVDTYINEDGTPKIFSMRLRNSGGMSYVDNSSSGGLFVGINLESGTLKKDAFTDFEKGSGKVFSKHPYTGVVFEGFEMPYFKETERLVKDAARLLPRAKVMAWDVAILQDGPVILEGNYFPGLQNCEISQRGFGKNPVFMEMLEEMKKQKANGSFNKQLVIVK